MKKEIGNLSGTKIKSTESQALFLFMEAKQVQKSTFSSLVWAIQ